MNSSLGQSYENVLRLCVVYSIFGCSKDTKTCIKGLVCLTTKLLLFRVVFTFLIPKKRLTFHRMHGTILCICFIYIIVIVYVEIKTLEHDNI